MHFTTSDGIDIFYTYHKQKQPCFIFLHGWTQNMTVWENEVEFYRKEGYSTLSIDLRGHGRSGAPKKESAYQLERFAQDIQELIQLEKIKKFVLVGQSMGGMIGMLAEQTFKQKPVALILINTAHKMLMGGVKEKVRPALERVIAFVEKHYPVSNQYRRSKEFNLNQFKDASEYEFFFEAVRHTRPETILACLDEIMKFDMTQTLGKIQTPTLLIHPKEDPFFPGKLFKKMCKNIPHIDEEIIQHKEHSSHVLHPEIICRFIEKFLDKHKLR